MNTPKIYTFGKKQKPEDDIRIRLRKHVMSGGAPKEFAVDEKLDRTTPGKMLEGMGIKKVFITEEEHAFLLNMRKDGVESLTARAERAEAEAEVKRLKRDYEYGHKCLCEVRDRCELWKQRAEKAEAELDKYLLACPASPTEEERRRCQQWWAKSGKSS